MKFSKNYYKYIIAVVFSLFVLSVNAREVCFDTPTSIKIAVPYCPPDTVCVTERIIIIHQCVTVPDEYTGPVTPPGSSPAPSGSAPPPYNELDNTRPVPEKPAYCNSLELDFKKCEYQATQKFKNNFNTETCAAAVAAGNTGSTVGSILATIEKIPGYARVASAIVAVFSAFGGAWGETACSMGPATALQNDLMACARDDIVSSEICAQFN